MDSNITANVSYDLSPGQMVIVHDHQCIVRTLLGSCIALIFFHKRTSTCIITHNLLPSESYRTLDHCKNCVNACQHRESDLKAKYVTCTVHYITDYLRKKLIPLHEVTVQIYGGSRLIKDETIFNIGKKNVVAAKEMIDHLGFRVTMEDTGGEAGRNIYIDTGSGVVTVKHHS